jgi:hypothetical protein
MVPWAERDRVAVSQTSAAVGEVVDLGVHI